MAAGVALVRWFGNEALRVYATFDQSDEQRDQRRLVEWIGLQGGHTTVSGLAHGPRAYRENSDPAKAAKAVLDDLARAGYGMWVSVGSGPKGGRPTSKFQLAVHSVTETTTGDAEDEGSSSSDAGDKKATPADQRETVTTSKDPGPTDDGKKKTVAA
jgi:hypothetical protein